MNSQRMARIYLRVSTKDQSLERQERIIKETKEKGFYVAGVYSEKSIGTTLKRPELMRMDDIQEGDFIIAESYQAATNKKQNN